MDEDRGSRRRREGVPAAGTIGDDHRSSRGSRGYREKDRDRDRPADRDASKYWVSASPEGVVPVTLQKPEKEKKHKKDRERERERGGDERDVHRRHGPKEHRDRERGEHHHRADGRGDPRGHRNEYESKRQADLQDPDYDRGTGTSGSTAGGNSHGGAAGAAAGGDASGRPAVQIVQRSAQPLKILGASGSVSSSIGARRKAAAEVNGDSSQPVDVPLVAGGAEKTATHYPAVHPAPPVSTASSSAPAVAKKKPPVIMPKETGPAFGRCRLMDEEWHVCSEAAQPLLLEQGSEFTVVACIGAQGTGKSTALSLLLASLHGVLVKDADDMTPGDGEEAASNGRDASPHAEGSSDKHGSPASDRSRRQVGHSTSTSAAPVCLKELPLQVHSFNDFLEGKASPAGVDMCVSSLDRLLLLDAQPLFNYESTSDGELKSEINSELKFMLFLLSICHTLLVVMDTPVDLHLLKFLRLLALLKSKVTDFAPWVERGGAENLGRDQLAAAAGEQKEALPRLVVAFNNVGSTMKDAELFAPARAFLQHSLWKTAPSLHFLRIPQLSSPSGIQGGPHEMLATEQAHRIGMRLRENVLSAGPARGRFGPDGLQLTERDWLMHIGGYWEFIQKAQIVNEYFSLTSKEPDSYGWPQF
eukprot:TRINITY_DN17297_c0_g1_i2.p1 TRINITY_DN17297_c0_g1~~TRINITY_DN17297_c0_g1_i2.p1  ORF type:complete len:644 (+),score=151.75 TRINITY_DN17297_c0_g1_i2:43-1974(+)